MPEQVTLPREVVDEALAALKRSRTHLIAFNDPTPYKDDPRWSPWTRFQKPLAERCQAAIDALNAAMTPREGS